jgi:hypothetical protein
MTAIPATNQTNTLANSILQKFDGNHDGSLSSDEFATFLTQLVGSLQTQQSPTATAPRATDLSTLFPSVPAPAAAFPSVPAPAAARSRVGYMAGFDDRKLGDESHTTIKYQIGRILQYCPNTPEGLQQALPEIQKLAPGAKIVGTNGDKIDFGDFEHPKSGLVGVIDVLVGAAQGGRSWAWQPIE